MASSSSSSISAISTGRLTDFHRAVFQVLSAHGCLADDVFHDYLTQLATDFHINTPIDLRNLFSTMNQYLRKLNFEVKTVLVTVGSEEVRQYHGIANTSNDEASKLYGSIYEPLRLKLFLRIIEELLMKKCLNSREFGEMRNVEGGGSAANKLSHSQVEDFGRQLCDDKWLQRDDRNYFIIGPRTFLELRSVLETTIRDSDLLDDDDDQRQRLINRLPQILIY